MRKIKFFIEKKIFLTALVGILSGVIVSTIFFRIATKAPVVAQNNVAIVNVAKTEPNKSEIDNSSVILNDVVEDYDDSSEVGIDEDSSNVAPELNSDVTSYNIIKTIKLERGGNVISALTRAGFDSGQVSRINGEVNKVFRQNELKNGQRIKLVYDRVISIEELLPTSKEKEIYWSKDKFIYPPIAKKVTRLFLKSMTINLADERRLIVSRASSNGSFNASLKKIQLLRKIVKVDGKIDNSLFVDAVRLGVPAKLAMKMIDQYSFDVDFQRDIRSGDKFTFLFDEYYDESGEKIKDGSIIYANLNLHKKDFKIYLFKDRKGFTDYYGEDAYTAKKYLLRTPLNGSRISSGFGYRKHPILGYTKLHKGIDFAAPTGTPIFAAGNGIIEYYGRFGGYGNYAMIRHSKEYATAYGHMSRFKKGLKLGSKVKQKQIIGYVGTTGRSTGPHLHYEIIRNSVPVNPMTVKFKSGYMLDGKDLLLFKEKRRAINNFLRENSNKVKVEVGNEKLFQ